MISRERGHYYVGAIDPGTRGEIWTALVMTTDATGKRVVVAHREWQPRPGGVLPIRETLAEIAGIHALYQHPFILSLAQNRIKPPPPVQERGSLVSFIADQFVTLEMRELAFGVGVPIHTRNLSEKQWHDMFESLRILVEEGRVELPNDANMRDDLLNVRRRLVQAGPRIDIPLGNVGRHADYARLLAMCCAEPCPRAPSGPDPVDEEAQILAKLEKQAQRGPFDRTLPTDRHKYWRM